ncbi:MAG TPA: GNAT family N-acetyltransferase, partial [Solirubrobacteraceae bacterium]|nr:GNAT family N-acetyltransferase [Solirubrobacteraceae bacterium]
MAAGAEPVVRDARSDDVAAICRFGEAHIPPHYAPLIGSEAAAEQVRRWWNEAHVGGAVAAGLVVVTEAGGQLVGVGQRGRSGADHVVYKLYVHPGQRGRGIGPRLLEALTRQLPPDADRLYIEHFVA